MALVHTAVISFREGTPDETKQTVYDMYQTLAEDCGGADAGIFEWKIGWNRDRRVKLGRTWDLVEFVVFRDDAALQAFRAHPKHTAVTDILRECADWVVGDMESPL